MAVSSASESEPGSAVRLLQVGNAIAHQVGSGRSGYYSGTTLSQESLEQMELGPEVFESILMEARDASLDQLAE